MHFWFIDALLMHFWCTFGALLVHFWKVHQKCTKSAPKVHQKWIKNASKMHQKCYKNFVWKVTIFIIFDQSIRKKSAITKWEHYISLKETIEKMVWTPKHFFLLRCKIFTGRHLAKAFAILLTLFFMRVLLLCFQRSLQHTVLTNVPHELNPFFQHGHYHLKGEVEVGSKKRKPATVPPSQPPFSFGPPSHPSRGCVYAPELFRIR